MVSSEKDPRRNPAILAVLIAAAVLALGLAACGGGGGGIEGGSEKEAQKVKLEGKASGDLTISNWPLYIDKKTVPDFEKASGVKVKYIEDINSNEEFFNKMQPLLQQGESGGRSIFVLADYQVVKMHKLGYLQEFDKAGLPEVEKNLVASLQHPSFDPNRDWTVPWQSGMTGVIVNKETAPDVRSICDLFDPKYKGKVDFLNEVRETVPLVMKCEGVDPDEATEADWMKAIDKIKGAAESGQVRRFTGNDYQSDLTSGNVVAVIGWSGDAVQLQADNPNLEWRMPTEGCMLWSEDMVIPIGAPNPTAAEAFMNFVYEPEVQANIAEYVNYVTPVEGVKEVLAKRDPELASNQLIFPSSSFTKKCSATPVFESEEEEQKVIKAFDAVLNG
ncbi:MAG: spermidine/putrescine transport system substrate-binding protein [Solirubrobacterales bacterium]|jgi:spermidine/putrescine transport system substrate-binding protein|nr:spermidine/putrescine transport system substrate-binding protein [Solirubrobacterales bacterium]